MARNLIPAPTQLVFALVLLSSAATVNADPIAEMMALWQYDKPRESAVFFSSLIAEATESANDDYLPAVLSQIARTYVLRGDLRAAQQQLDEVAGLIKDPESRAQVFYFLELGRAFNTNGDRKQARILFRDAFRISERIGDDYLSIDAAHMMSIAEELHNQHRWNVIALKIAEKSDSELAQGWLGTLYNNMGWTYFDEAQYTKALELFESAAAFRQQRGQRRREQIARWAVGRTLRALGRLSQALDIQVRLLDERVASGLDADGQVVEEIAEIRHLQGSQDARTYFARAYRLLSADPYLVENEPERLARLQALSTGTDIPAVAPLTD